jgi:hypothetical protein
VLALLVYFTSSACVFVQAVEQFFGSSILEVPLTSLFSTNVCNLIDLPFIIIIGKYYLNGYKVNYLVVEDLAVFVVLVSRCNFRSR